MSVITEHAEAISHEIMPRVYRAVLDASHRSERVTVVVGPELWADIMRVSRMSRKLVAADLIRDNLALPRIMDVEIIDDQSLGARDIVVRAEVRV